MASSGTGVCGTTVFAASSISPVTKKTTMSRSARRPRLSTSRPAASASVATVTNSTPPTTEVTIPTASRTRESVLWVRSSTRTSRGRNSPAQAAAEQTRNAAVESSKISLLSPFTSSQVTRGGHESAGLHGPALLDPRCRKRAIRRGTDPPQIAHSTTSVQQEQKADMLTSLQGGSTSSQNSLGYGVAQDAAVLSTFQDTFRLP